MCLPQIPRTTPDGRSPSSHAPLQSSKKKSKTNKAPNYTKYSSNKALKSEPTATGSQKIASSRKVSSASLKGPPNLDTLRSTPAFSTEKQTWAAKKTDKNSSRTHIKTGVDCQVIDLTSIPKSATGVTSPTGYQTTSNHEVPNPNRSTTRVPWHSGDPTCSPPREMTFGSAL